MDNVLEEVRRVLTISSAEAEVTERYVADARRRIGGVAGALAGSDAARLASRDFLADLWWTEELLAGVGRAWGLQHRPFSSELPVEGDDPEGMATMGYGGYGNMPPVAVNDYYSTMHDVPLEVSAASGVLENDYDPNPGTTLTAICTGGPTHGALSLDPDGSFTYTPPDKWADTATFWYKASDGSLLSNEASVRITVMNNAPYAGSEYYTAVYNTPLVVPEADGVKRNDGDYDGDAITVSVATPPSHGTVNLNATTGAFTYTPATDYVGEDTFTYKARDGVRRADGSYYESYPATVSLTVGRPYPDVDVDSDNNGVVDRNQYEENEEMNDPGMVIWWNIDDDNGNSVQDRSDPGPFVNPQGQPVEDNDLFPMRLSAPSGVPYYGNLKDFTLELSKSGNLALWKTRDKQALSTSYRIGTHQIPTEAFVEGTDYGQGQIAWILKNPAGTEVSRDTVKVTVAWDNLTGYRPQTEGPGYGSPFARTAVAGNLAMTPGVGIRRNGDDDNANQVADRLETGIQGENDLIEMVVSTIPNASPGIQYWLRRYNTNLTVWDTSTKTGDWFGTAMQRQVTPSAGSAWVEWNTMAPIQTGADLSLYIWDVTHQRVVPGSTVTLHFYPFTSVVIVLGGEGQVPGDPVPPPENGNYGMFEQVAVPEYRNGYDVHMYDEDAVSRFLGAGPAYDEVVNAIQGRGVTEVAIMGYSHGGGATYQLAERLYRNTVPGD